MKLVNKNNRTHGDTLLKKEVPHLKLIVVIGSIVESKYEEYLQFA